MQGSDVRRIFLLRVRPYVFPILFYVGLLIYSLLRRRSLGSSRADETHCYSQDTYYYSEDTYYLFSVIVRVRVVFRKTVVGDWRFRLSGSHLQGQGLDSQDTLFHKTLILIDKTLIVTIDSTFHSNLQFAAILDTASSVVVVWRFRGSSGEKYSVEKERK